jgi:hypothetical protein
MKRRPSRSHETYALRKKKHYLDREFNLVEAGKQMPDGRPLLFSNRLEMPGPLWDRHMVDLPPLK